MRQIPANASYRYGDTAHAVHGFCRSEAAHFYMGVICFKVLGRPPTKNALIKSNNNGRATQQLKLNSGLNRSLSTEQQMFNDRPSRAKLKNFK